MKFSKTSNKMFSYIFTIVIFIISVLTFLIISISMKNVYLHALDDMTTVAIHNIDEHISMYKNEAYIISQLQSTDNLLIAIDEGNQKTEAYEEAKNQTYDYISNKEKSPSINKIMLTDKNKKVVLSSVTKDIDQIIPNDSEYWNNINENTSTAQILLNDQNEYIILVAQPLRLYNKTAGYVFIELNFDMINTLINSYKFGNSGNLFFITQNNEFIGSNKSSLPKSILDIKNYDDILDLLKTQTHNTQKIKSSEFKSNNVSNYMQYCYIDNLNAIIATSINKVEVNRTSVTTSFPLVFLLLMIFILTLGYRFIISKKILHPLSLLNRSLYLLKKGDLRARYNYNADNEFGNLSIVFNQTISNLQKTTINLREREAKSNIILNNIADVIWEYDLASKTMKLPENWSKLIEAEYSEISYLYTLDTFTSYLHINYSSEFSQILNNCIDNNTPINFECQIKKQNNEYIWVKINGSCMYNVYEEPFKVIGSISNISEIKNREHTLREFAKRDDMTKLLKKVEMEHLVDIDLEKNSIGHSLLFIDLDDFKDVNDTYGHLIGDEIIIHIANILKELCIQDCHICRFGGDEFVIYTKKVYTLPETEQLASRIIAEFNAGCTVSSGEHIRLEVSIGIARSPKDGTTYAELMSKADEATYKAKNTVKNCYVVYTNCQ